jgi:WD40 repeat protein
LQPIYIHPHPQPAGAHAPVLPEQLGSRVKSIAYSADGSTAAVALFDSTVAVFDLATGKRLAQLIRRGDRDGTRVHSGGVNAVYLSRSGDVAVTVSKDNTARVWDVAEAARITKRDAEGGGAAGGWGLSDEGAAAGGEGAEDADGASAASSAAGGLVAPAAAAAAFLSAAPVKPRRASAPPVPADGGGFFAGSFLGSSSTAGGQPQPQLAPPATPLSADGISDGGASRWSSSSFTRPSGGSRISGPAIGSTVLAGHSDSVGAAALSADGRQLATASFDGTARVWDMKSGACTKVRVICICS